MTDPASIAAKLSEAQRRCLRALPSQPNIWATVSEMRGRGATGSGLDILYISNLDNNLCRRRWVKWGSEPGQIRGRGFEYTITPLGLAVKAHLESEPKP